MIRLLLCSIILLLAACSGKAITVAPVTMPVANNPQTQPMSLNDVQWKVLNQDDIRALSKELETNPNKKVGFYVLDTSNFETLVLNLEEMKRYILEQRQVILFHEGLNAAVEPTPKKAN